MLFQVGCTPKLVRKEEPVAQEKKGQAPSKQAPVKYSRDQVFKFVQTVSKGVTDEKARQAKAYEKALEALAGIAGVDRGKYKNQGELVKAVLAKVAGDTKNFGPHARKKAGEALEKLKIEEKKPGKGACGKLWETAVISTEEAVKSLNVLEKGAKDKKLQEADEYKRARQTVIDYAGVGFFSQLFAFKETELRTALKLIAENKGNKFEKQAAKDAKQVIEATEKQEKEAAKAREQKPGKK